MTNHRTKGQRLYTLPLCLLLPLGATAQKQATPNATPKTPNVIFILADDLGYGDVGCYGQKLIRTPHIDRLATEGMQMTDFYAGSTVSAPSRASLMTGLNTGHTQVRGNKEIAPEGQMPMNPDRQTLGDLFKAAGYTTGIFGKWGLGFPGSGSEPQDRGFDTFYGYNCQRLAHYYYPTHLWSNREKVFFPENENNDCRTYSADLIHQNALAFIQSAAQAGKPFFCMLTYTLPHAELNLPHDSKHYQYYNQTLTPRPWDGRDGYPMSDNAHASFAAMVSKMDDCVGDVCALLKQLGLDENTIVIFTSDNGPHREGGADPDYFDSNGPLRGIKRDLYEGGIREPMIVRWPAQIKPGSQSKTPGAFWDFMPTFASLLGQPLKGNTDGQSLLPVWQGETEKLDKWQNRPLYWEFHAYNGRQALRQGKWKLVVLDINKTPKVELYDLSKDLGETTDLSAKYPQKVKEMRDLMKRMRTPSAIYPFKGEVAEKK